MVVNVEGNGASMCAGALCAFPELRAVDQKLPAFIVHAQSSRCARCIMAHSFRLGSKEGHLPLLGIEPKYACQCLHHVQNSRHAQWTMSSLRPLRMPRGLGVRAVHWCTQFSSVTKRSTCLHMLWGSLWPCASWEGSARVP